MPPPLSIFGGSIVFALQDVVIYLLLTTHEAEKTVGLEQHLGPQDQRRLQQITSARHRRRFLLSRVLLRSALSQIDGTDVTAHAWRFDRGPNGKPTLRTPPSSIASFNLAYADPIIALAVSKTSNVGIDIEIADPFPREELPWHLFAADEQSLLRRTSDQDFWYVFFRLWTLKEAIAKRVGLGFSTNFHEINTVELDIIDELQDLDAHTVGDSLLFHKHLILLDHPLHLALSKSSSILRNKR